MKKLVLFDIDGTLLITDGAAGRAFAAAMVDVYGTAGPVEEVSFAGKTDPQIAHELLAHAVEGRDVEDDRRGVGLRDGRVWGNSLRGGADDVYQPHDSHQNHRCYKPKTERTARRLHGVTSRFSHYDGLADPRVRSANRPRLRNLHQASELLSSLERYGN